VHRLERSEPAFYDRGPEGDRDDAIEQRRVEALLLSMRARGQDSAMSALRAGLMLVVSSEW